jgi:tetratricopeptide (TPR) repeat protein
MEVIRMHKSIPLIWFLLVTGLGGSATADARADRAKAKELFGQAEVHYAVGRFEEALKDYSKAYELARLPGFLFNIGQCYRELKDYDRAALFYESYLREKPDAKNRGVVESLVAEAKGRIAEQEQEKRRNEDIALELEAERVRDEKRSRTDTGSSHDLTKPIENTPSQGAVSPPNILTVSESPKAKKSALLYEKWWFWTIVGSAVAVAAGSTIYALSSRGKDEMPAGTIGTVDFR